MKLAGRVWIFSHPSCYFHINITKIAGHIFSWGIDIDSCGNNLPVGIYFGSGRVCPFFNPQKDSNETFWGMPCTLVATRPNSILRIAAIWCFSVMRIPLFHFLPELWQQPCSPVFSFPNKYTNTHPNAPYPCFTLLRLCDRVELKWC